MHKHQDRGGSVRNQPLVTDQEESGFQVQPITYIKPSGWDGSHNLEFVWVFRKIGTQLLCGYAHAGAAHVCFNIQ